jgi:hypothetical protein
MSKKFVFLDELDQSDIVIPTSFLKNDLNPLIWKNMTLNPVVKEKLLTIGKRYHEFLKVKAMYTDIYFVGSMANFNWTEQSDVDIHVVYDFSEINSDEELVRNYMDAKQSIWSEMHHITVKGFDVELYGQSVTEEFHSKGIYSLLNDEWVSKPEKEKFSIDKKALKVKIEALGNSIERLVSKEGKADETLLYAAAHRLKDKIKKIRQSGLSKSGEFSLENLAFKYLRNNGFIEKLMNLINNSMDKELSLDESNVITKNFKIEEQYTMTNAPGEYRYEIFLISDGGGVSEYYAIDKWTRIRRHGDGLPHSRAKTLSIMWTFNGQKSTLGNDKNNYEYVLKGRERALSDKTVDLNKRLEIMQVLRKYKIAFSK